MLIVPLYAALLGALFTLLSVRTLRLRRTLTIAIGDAGNASMLRAIRVHANFAEYVPLCLMLIWFSEGRGAPAVIVHALGVCLLAGRMAHAFGVSREKEDYRFRVAGMVLTFTALVSASAWLLASYLR